MSARTRCSMLSGLLALTATGLAVAQPVRLELRIIPQSGTVTSPAGAGVSNLAETTPATPIVKTGATRTQRYELQYRVLDLDPFDAVFVPAGLSAAQIDIVVSNPAAGTFARAQLSRFEAQLAGTSAPTNPDVSGLPAGSAAVRQGLHAPYRSGMADQNNNDLTANGAILANQQNGGTGPNITGIVGVLPLAISQTNQGNANNVIDNTIWYGLYSFTFTASEAFVGEVTITAEAIPDINTGNRFGWFNDGAAVPEQSNNAVPAITHLSIQPPSPPGACCSTDGSCSVLDAGACAAQGSSFIGVSTSCAPSPCPMAGACCLPTGACIGLTQSACIAQAGQFQGEGTNCGSGVCPPSIACCLANNVCTTLTSAACSSQSGTVGAAAGCTPNLCPPPYACCLPGFVCLLASAAGDCVVAGGTPLVRSTCTPQLCCPTPVVAAHPQDQLLVVPQPITLTVQASHPGSLSYEWRHDGVPLVTDPRAQGATSPSLTLTDTIPADAGTYSVIVTSSCGSATTSAAATVTLCTDPVVLTGPASTIVEHGSALNLSVQATGPGSLRFQWRKNGQALVESSRISGVNTTLLVIAPVEVADDAAYDCVVTNECGAVASLSATVSVTCTGGPADCNSNGVCDVRDLAGGSDLVAPNPASGDKFGWAVATDGGRAVIGARTRMTAAGAGAGAVYVFETSGSVWTINTELTAPDGAPNDDFGNQVAVEGSWIAIAARHAAVGATQQAGAVYLFRSTGGVWQFFQKITEPTPTSNAAFGHGIDLNGDRLVIGSILGTGAQPGSGVAYVYRFNGLNWAQEAAISAPDGQSGDGFGISVAISDTYLIVGAPNDVESGIPSGSAYVFFRGLNGWGFQTKVLPRSRQANATFGELVAMSGDIAMVNCPRESINSLSSAGAVYMFRRSDVRWTQQRRLVAETPQANELFGFYIAIENGNAVIGGFNRTIDGLTGAGQFSVYKRLGNYWIRAGRVESPKPESPGWFGYALAISGARIVAGAHLGSAGIVAQAGWVRVFDLNTMDCNGNSLPDVCEIATGAAIDANGNTIPDDCETLICPADFNDSGVISVQDLFDFLADYFQGTLTADVNNSGVLSVQDIFDFLAQYFAGCP